MREEFFAKADENLRASEALFDLGLPNASANRAYYAAFHAALAALANYGFTHPENPHEWVQAQFASELIHRRKIFPLQYAGTLQEIQRIRNLADYKPEPVSKKAVERQLRKAKDFFFHIQNQLDHET